MNAKWLWAVVALACLGIVSIRPVSSQSSTRRAAHEYATVWWDGTDNSKLIRPDGTVESLAPLFMPTKRPASTDDRSFYLTLALNTLAKDGWEYAGTLNKDIILKRPAAR
jgi:hypothetical protein